MILEIVMDKAEKKPAMPKDIITLFTNSTLDG